MHLETVVMTLLVLSARAEKSSLTEKLGSVYFIDHTRTINYDINLHSYYVNVNTFAELLQNLTEMCPQLPPETLCTSFVYNYKQDLIEMKRNVDSVRINHRQRNKRNFLTGAMSNYFLTTTTLRNMAVGSVSGALASYFISLSPDLNELRGEQSHHRSW